MASSVGSTEHVSHLMHADEQHPCARLQCGCCWCGKAIRSDDEKPLVRAAAEAMLISAMCVVTDIAADAQVLLLLPMLMHA
jgi:hypothetical protein